MELEIYNNTRIKQSKIENLLNICCVKQGVRKGAILSNVDNALEMIQLIRNNKIHAKLYPVQIKNKIGKNIIISNTRSTDTLEELRTLDDIYIEDPDKFDIIVGNIIGYHTPYSIFKNRNSTKYGGGMIIKIEMPDNSIVSIDYLGQSLKVINNSVNSYLSDLANKIKDINLPDGFKILDIYGYIRKKREVQGGTRRKLKNTNNKN